MRVELHGCRHSEGLVGYSIPQGAQSDDLDLKDEIFDGETNSENSRLENGLGQLADGRIGADKYTKDLGYGVAYEWVGWENSTAGKINENK